MISDRPSGFVHIRSFQRMELAPKRNLELLEWDTSNRGSPETRPRTFRLLIAPKPHLADCAVRKSTSPVRAALGLIHPHDRVHDRRHARHALGRSSGWDSTSHQVLTLVCALCMLACQTKRGKNMLIPTSLGAGEEWACVKGEDIVQKRFWCQRLD